MTRTLGTTQESFLTILTAKLNNVSLYLYTPRGYQYKELIKVDTNSRRISFKVVGMTCAACSSRVERALAKLEGVTQASVNLATETASVTFESTKTNTKKIFATVEKAGYSASPNTKTVTLIVKDMTCAACSSKIERALQRLNGVQEASVNLATGKATVVYEE